MTRPAFRRSFLAAGLVSWSGRLGAIERGTPDPKASFARKAAEDLCVVGAYDPNE